MSSGWSRKFRRIFARAVTPSLSGASERGADLTEALLGETQLSGGYLTGTNEQSADLSWADWAGVDLAGAILVKSDVRRFTLAMVDLRRRMETTNGIRRLNVPRPFTDRVGWCRALQRNDAGTVVPCEQAILLLGV